MSKLYVMQFATAAEASSAVSDNPDAYAPGTIIFAVAEGTLHYVSAAGVLTGALAIVP